MNDFAADYPYHERTLAKNAPIGQRIRSDIEQKILSGEWPPGHRIPYEFELVASYGCARMTVNRALASLVESGLIERRRRAGSFVARPLFQSAVLTIPDLAQEIAGRGDSYGYELLSRRLRKTTKLEAKQLSLPASTPIIELECRHLANLHPVALEHRIISLNTVPQAEQVDFKDHAPGSWLLEHVSWTEAEHRISAINADEEEARALKVDLDSACLCIERRTWRMGATVTFVRQIFSGSTYALTARFSP